MSLKISSIYLPKFKLLTKNKSTLNINGIKKRRNLYQYKKDN